MRTGYEDRMTITNNTDIMHYSSDNESSAREEMLGLLKRAPIPDDQLLSNIGLFIESKNLARMLFMDHLYRQIVDVHGVVMEFGTRWGQNASLLAALRGIYEPFNRHRRIVAFDTFTGFPSLAPEDGGSNLMQMGQLATAEGYEQFLAEVIGTQEALNPLSHIKKFEICKGDATVQLPQYLERSPETIVAFAYMDFDLYEPTKAVLEAIKPRLARGAVVVLDELGARGFPGEAQALDEVFGFNNVRLQHFSHQPHCAWFRVGD